MLDLDVDAGRDEAPEARPDAEVGRGLDLAGGPRGVAVRGGDAVLREVVHLLLGGLWGSFWWCERSFRTRCTPTIERIRGDRRWWLCCDVMCAEVDCGLCVSGCA